MDTRPQFLCRFPRRVSKTMKEMITLLPQAVCTAKIRLVEDDAALSEAIAEISSEKILGFDTETKPSHRPGENYPVSILQLCGKDKSWVIRLSKFQDRLPEIFKILENPDIKKVGVGMKGDINGLKKLCKFNEGGFDFIENIVDKMHIGNTGLRNLTALFFGRRLSKSAQMSNWAAAYLNSKQLEYAATDAWISRELYLEIKRVFAESNFDIEPDLPSEEPPFSFKRLVRKCVGKISKRIGDIFAAGDSAKRGKSAARGHRGGRRNKSRTQNTGGRSANGNAATRGN